MRYGITQRSAIYQRKAPDIKNPSRHLLEAARFALEIYTRVFVLLQSHDNGSHLQGR